jgi:DNA-binding LytR/AlgR family response regulator
MNYSYIIIDDNQESFLNTKAVADGFSELIFVAAANNYSDGLNLILEFKPDLIFLEINPTKKESNLSLALINELYRFLNVIPKIIVTTTNKDLAFDAIQYEVADYLLKPLVNIDFVKLILKLNKSCAPFQPPKEQTIIFDEKQASNVNHQPLREEKQLTLCVKSYGDYRYIDAKDICYLQADNNSTDIHLNNGEMITAFKTLKHFEGILSFPFIRIHNSYIVNRNYISRIQTGNSVFYIKNTIAKLPFSKSYKTNVDLIISDFSNGNYLEI